MLVWFFCVMAQGYVLVRLTRGCLHGRGYVGGSQEESHCILCGFQLHREAQRSSVRVQS